MAQDFGQQAIRSEKGDVSPELATPEAASQLKKRARRRLIGAFALTLLAAIVLPIVMDHQPSPPLKEIQVRIPSPDEGGAQRVVAKPIAKEEPVKPVLRAEPEPKPEAKSEPKPEAKSEPKPEAKPEPKPVAKAEPEAKPEAKPEPKPEVKPRPADEKVGGESWEVQLGAYQDQARVKLLVGKLKQLGLPTYTENVDTPNGLRTRVRAGPFPSQEAADKAKTRIKIIGVDGPVAKKP